MKIRKLLSTLLAVSVSLSMVFGSALTAYANEPDIEIIEEVAETIEEETVQPEEAPAPEIVQPEETPAAVDPAPAPTAEVPSETPATVEETQAAVEEPPVAVEEIPAAPEETSASDSEASAPPQENTGSDTSEFVGGSSQKVINPDYIDAEKFMAGNYDSNLCWAATAANMLWGSEFAQGTLNPITGDYFQNEDEVFDYFRKCFTDKAGVPDGALEYFFNGTYQYAGDDYASQLREDAPAGGMMPTDEQLYDVVGHTTTTDVLDMVVDLTEKTAGALLKWWNIDQAETAADLGAHWLTIVQLVLNESGGYQGIWLADSDNDPAGADPQYEDVRTREEAAVAAASMPNSYTYYELTYEQLGEAYYWIINDFTDDPNLKTYLYAIAYLMNIREGGGGDPSEIDYGDDEEDVADESTVAPEDHSPDKQPQITQEEVRQIVLNEIKSMMVEKNIVIFSPTNDVYDKNSNTGYNLIIRRPFTSLSNVFINGIRLEQAGIDYTIQKEPNGLFTLIINKEYLMTLEPGTYTITLEFDGTEPITCTLIVK